MTSRRRPPLLQAGIAALLLLVLYLVRTRSPATEPGSPAPNRVPSTGRGAPTTAPGSTSVSDAFRDRRSGVELETGGRVTRVLSDDREGARHERFILRIGEVRVLVAHNLDLAPRVPLAAGDSVELRGEYEWNEQGGVIHWTHRDPDGRHAAGWIRHDGRLYQ